MKSEEKFARALAEVTQLVCTVNRHGKHSEAKPLGSSNVEPFGHTAQKLVTELCDQFAPDLKPKFVLSPGCHVEEIEPPLQRESFLQERQEGIAKAEGSLSPIVEVSRVDHFPGH